MSASMHIHSDSYISEEAIKCVMGNTIGSKYFGYKCPLERKYGLCEKHYDDVANSDQVTVGDVSWLKAALFEDDKYIPDTIGTINDILHDVPFLTERMAKEIDAAFGLDNESIYENTDESVRERVKEFCKRNIGSLVFTISW